MKLVELLDERQKTIEKLALAEQWKMILDKKSREGPVSTEDAGPVGSDTVLDFLADIDAFLVDPMLKRLTTINEMEVDDERKEAVKEAGKEAKRKGSKKKRSAKVASRKS